MTISKEILKKLPKAELHCHLDGSLRVSTILELAAQQKVQLPAHNQQDLHNMLAIKGKMKNLEEYLEKFLRQKQILVIQLQILLYSLN